ncbi:hypothetical protein QTP86_031149 [Hemibagrus guttatus]|nr:hypothetical protein QTP86_031149 [Hemibagrus guttatus]
MYQGAEIYLPRKKKVREAFRSNTYRIFDEKVPERLNPDEVIKDHKHVSRDPEVTEMLKTRNIPQPYKIKFIRTNVRFLNEPIVHMETDNTKDEQSKWWLNTSDKNEPRKTAYIPTLSPLGQPKELVEHVSFIHQYDSRRIHNQPYQGKLRCSTSKPSPFTLDFSEIKVGSKAGKETPGTWLQRKPPMRKCDQ